MLQILSFVPSRKSRENDNGAAAAKDMSMKKSAKDTHMEKWHRNNDCYRYEKLLAHDA